MPVFYTVGEEADFDAKLKLHIPLNGHVSAIVYDSSGSELDRATFVVEDAKSVELAKKFLTANAPPTMDVQQAWDQAGWRSQRKPIAECGRESAVVIAVLALRFRDYWTITTSH